MPKKQNIGSSTFLETSMHCIKTSMKLHFVEEMDEVLGIALEEKLSPLEEDVPAALSNVIPPVIPVSQPVAHQ